MNAYSSTSNVNPDQLKPMLKLGRKKVGDGSFRTAIGQQAHHSMPAEAIRKIVGAGQSPYAPRRMDNIGASIAGSARTLGQQKKSIYRNPVLARRQPLDPSQVEDRRPPRDASGGAFDDELDPRPARGSFGARPLPASARRDVALVVAGEHARRLVNEASTTARVGALKHTVFGDGSFPWKPPKKKGKK